MIDYDHYVHTKGQAELVLILSFVSVSTLKRITTVFLAFGFYTSGIKEKIHVFASSCKSARACVSFSTGL